MVITHDLRLKCPAVPVFQKDIPEEPADQRLCNHLGTLYNFPMVQQQATTCRTVIIAT